MTPSGARWRRGDLIPDSTSVSTNYFPPYTGRWIVFIVTSESETSTTDYVAWNTLSAAGGRLSPDLDRRVRPVPLPVAGEVPRAGSEIRPDGARGRPYRPQPGRGRRGSVWAGA
ncbi:hypothetical protein FRAAL1623 [Frankia alni ACN14a]|uniref:Uncharacterized protein n=1 Tax=Frankia alni (strain DSM 45986 / CECT 9034 / ACN14a) TaxID=326424 RepID=Q0RQ98_FRAAA|nr:hypothetical protein FRAAL1623 [Frankia alni ACN14a]